MSKLQAALQGVQAPSVSLRDLKQREFRGGAIQAAPTKTTDYSSQLNGLMQQGAQAMGAYVDYREQEGTKRKNELMLKHLDRTELGKLRQSGALLYQDDPYAMRALDKELGRSEAYTVDTQVQANIDSGLWNTRQKVEEGRAYLMKNAQTTMGETYGVNPANNQYFLEGFQSDQVDRDFAIYNSVAKKEHAEKVNLGFTSASSNISDMVSAGVPMADVVNYLNQNGREGSGLIPNDEMKEKLLMQYAKDIAATPNGPKLINEALDVPLDLYGRKDVTLRQRLGAEGVNSLQLTAAENGLKLDKERAKWLIGGLSFISNIDGTSPDADTAVRDKYAEISAQLDAMEQTEQTTSARMQLEQAMVSAEGRLREGNAKREAALVKERQDSERISNINWVAERRMNGSDEPINLEAFTETGTTGKYNANDYNLAFYAYRESIADLPESEQIQKLLKYANAFPEGNAGAAAWKASAMQGYNKETTQVNLAIQGGRDIPETPKRDAMLDAYRADPEGFTANFPEYAEETIEMAVIQDSGIDYQTFYKGKMEWDKLEPQAKMQRSVEVGAMLVESHKDNIFNKLPPSAQNIYVQSVMGISGLKPNEATRTIKTALDRKYQTIGAGGNRGFVDKQILQVDPNDTGSVRKGRAGLEAYVSSAYGDNASLVGISSDSRGNIRIMHPSAGEMVLTKAGLMEWMKKNKRL